MTSVWKSSAGATLPASMDTQGFHHSPVKPQRSSSSINGFPILAISIIGILTTSLLLLSYYVFVIKCCINRRHPDVNLRLSWPQSRRHDPSRSSSSSSSSRLLGLSESTIRAIPSFRYREHRDDGARHGRRLHECTVCLNEFREEQRIRLLPRCRHVFHIDCIDTWLQSNANCPLCRSSATPAAPIERFIAPVDVHHGSGVAASRVEDGDGRGLAQAPEKSEQGKRLLYLVSKGDECINVRSRSDDEEEMFCVQPMRRSFSVDSSGDKQLHVAHQKILQLSAESSGGSSSGHRRPFFSFGRSSERAVLPVKIEL